MGPEKRAVSRLCRARNMRRMRRAALCSGLVIGLAGVASASSNPPPFRAGCSQATANLTGVKLPVRGNRFMRPRLGRLQLGRPNSPGGGVGPSGDHDGRYFDQLATAIVFGHAPLTLVSLDPHVRMDMTGDVLSEAFVRFDTAVRSIKFVPCRGHPPSAWWVGFVIDDHPRCARFALHDSRAPTRTVMFRVGFGVRCA